MFLIALFACTNSGQLTLDDGDGTGDDPGLDDAGGEGENEEPETHPAMGAYSGDVSAEIPEWSWEICAGDIDIEVDDEGAFEGSGICVAESDWAGSQETEITVEGSIDEDGEVSGEIIYEIPSRDGTEEREADLEGVFDDGDLDLEWVDELDWGGGGGGGGGGGTEVFGRIRVELDD